MVGKRGRAGSVVALATLLGALLTPAGAGAAPLDAVQADRLRIRQHLSRVEQQLRQAPVDGLTAPAQQQRARLLDELHRYWQAGIFPRSSGHPNERRPYFIDDDGRACAVGALIQRSGHEALARRIDDTFHTEYVPNMQDAELLAWAGEHGFSVQELALIQPTYCACGTSNDGAGGAGGAAGEDAAAYQPVCGANGLTYWNACAAELCGGVEVVAAGECQYDPPCELCGTGDSYVAVSECGVDGIQGLCGLDANVGVIPVSDGVAARWLELQERNCQDPDYVLPVDDESSGWQAAKGSAAAEEIWTCEATGGQPDGAAGAAGEPSSGGSAGTGSSEPAGGTEASSGGAPDSSASDTEASSGCTCSTAARRSWSSGPLLLLGLALLRRRRTR